MTKCHPGVEATIEFILLKCDSSVRESQEVKEFSNNLRILYTSQLFFTNTVLSSAHLGSENDLFFSEYLPKAEAAFTSSYRKFQAMFRYDKQPLFISTGHMLIKHWKDLLRRNPFSTPDCLVGIGFGDETLLEHSNKFRKDAFSHHIRKNISPEKGCADALKHALLSQNPDFYLSFKGMGAKSALKFKLYRRQYIL